MTIKAIIIEDIHSYLDTLQNMLKQFKQIDIVATATTKSEAINAISLHQPDLIFLDIQLGNNNGLDILEACKNMYKYVIFTTCHDEFALEGYKYNTVHYLLKPITQEELTKAIEKIPTFDSTIVQTENMKNMMFNIQHFKGQKLFFPDKNRYIATEVDSIMYITSEASYSNIHTIDRILKISKNLGFMENFLVNYPEFVRVHRSAIVNINYITSVKRGVDSQLTLYNGLQIPISLKEKSDLFTLLGIKEN